MSEHEIGCLYIVTFAITGQKVNQYRICNAAEMKEKITESSTFMNDVSVLKLHSKMAAIS